MRNIRTLIIFAMIFVVLAVLVFVQSKQQPSAIVATPTAGQNVAQLFPDVTLDVIQAIRLQSPETGKTFLLTRAADGSWTAPDTPGKLSAIAANDIARTMVVLPYGETLPLQPNDDKKNYGFTPSGVLLIEIILTNGVSHAVEVGYRTPTQERYYALVDDRPDLYLLERPAIDFLISTLKNPPVA